ncbi:MAG: hypothetical protein V3T49_06995 [Dehalococcoidia bacterium]
MVRITLAALFLIPLVFPIGQTGHPFGEMKVFVLHLAMSLVTVLWLWQKVLRMQRDREIGRAIAAFSLTGWAARSPARWAVIALIVMWVAQIVSTALSPLPALSIFGGNEQFPGGNLYDSFSLLMVFLVVAFKFRTRERLEQIAWVLIASATIAAGYGIAQHFGWDPLGNRITRRVLSSFGNTLNFSAYLGMAVPVTIAISLRKSGVDRRLQLLLGLALSLQMAGMWFSESRGPLVGGAVAIGVLFFGIVLVRSRTDLITSGLVTLIGLIGAAVLVFIPSSQSSRGLTAALSIGSEITNLGTGATSSDGGGGLPGRIQNWKNTLQLAQSWDVPEDEPTLKRITRPLFGLGPEMFAYSYPLVGDPHPDRHFTAHPHNYPLWILMGQGFVGLGLLIASTLLILLSAWLAVKRIRSGVARLPAFDWLLIAFTAGLAGKIVESQVGVARISDLAMNFALAGAVIAVAEIISSDVQSAESGERSPGSRFAISAQAIFRTALAGALVITVLASWLFVSWDMRRLSASLDITFAPRAADGTVELIGLVNAQDGAPERRNFTMQLADFYFIAAKNAWQDNRADDARRLALFARDLLIEFEKQDPYERNTQLALAKTSSTLVDWGFTEHLDEMRDRYLRLAELFRTYPSLVSTSATAMARVGDDAMAIELAERAIATEDSTKPWGVAWYAKGAALINLGEDDLAIEALTTAVEKEPESGSAQQAHIALAFIYMRRGETDLAEYHTNEAGG